MFGNSKYDLKPCVQISYQSSLGETDSEHQVFDLMTTYSSTLSPHILWLLHGLQFSQNNIQKKSRNKHKKVLDIRAVIKALIHKLHSSTLLLQPSVVVKLKLATRDHA